MSGAAVEYRCAADGGGPVVPVPVVAPDEDDTPRCLIRADARAVTADDLPEIVEGVLVRCA